MIFSSTNPKPAISFHTFLHRRSNLTTILLVTVAVFLVAVHHSLTSSNPTISLFSAITKLSSQCPQPNDDPSELTGGDCQAFGRPRRPTWACHDPIKRALPEFLKVYDRRPIQTNDGGMRIEHAVCLRTIYIYAKKNGSLMQRRSLTRSVFCV